MAQGETTRTELLRGTLDMLILKTLSVGGVMHGYAVARHIEQVSNDVLQVEEGSLYPALRRLELQGLVASDWGHTAGNRRARYYRLTADGRRALGQVEADFARIVDAIGRVMRVGSVNP